MSQPASDDDEDDRDDALLRQLRLARERPDGALRADLLLAQMIARYEKDIRKQIEWRAHTQQPSVADIDEMVQAVRIGIVKDIDKVLAGTVELGAVIGRKVSDQTAEFARRRARRAGEISDEALALVGVEDSPSLEAEAAELRALVAELPERDRVFRPSASSAACARRRSPSATACTAASSTLPPLGRCPSCWAPTRWPASAR